METRLALAGIIIEDESAVEEVNELLHQYRDLVVGRMGIPYRQRKVAVISLVLDGTGDRISALTGKLGMIRGLSVKTVYSRHTFLDPDGV